MDARLIVSVLVTFISSLSSLFVVFVFVFVFVKGGDDDDIMEGINSRDVRYCECTTV